MSEIIETITTKWPTIKIITGPTSISTRKKKP